MIFASDALVLNKRDVDAAATGRADAWARDLFPPKIVKKGTFGAFGTALLDVPRDLDLGVDDDCDEDEGLPQPPRTWTHVNGATRKESFRDGHSLLGVVFPRKQLFIKFDHDALHAAFRAALALPNLERFKGVFHVKRKGWILAQWVKGDADVHTMPISRAADSRFQLIIRGEAPHVTAVAALETAYFDAVVNW